METATFLSLFANTTRLLILYYLMITGELSVGALAKAAQISQSALSQHLTRLRAEDVVATRRKGQTIFYRLARNNRGRYTVSFLRQTLAK